MKLESAAFEPGKNIPKKFTCDGEDISPPLTWDDPPAGTQSLALIADDPDAPGKTWVHWVLFNIPPQKRALPEKRDTARTIEDGMIQGVTDFGKTGYGGPCPPSGIHRYYFKLYALDQSLSLDSSATKADLLNAMEGHILEEAQLMGTYSRG